MTFKRKKEKHVRPLKMYEKGPMPIGYENVTKEEADARRKAAPKRPPKLHPDRLPPLPDKLRTHEGFLEAAFEFINSEDKWCKGRPIVYHSDRSPQCCSFGAILKVNYLWCGHLMTFAFCEQWLNKAAMEQGYASYIELNDAPNTTYLDIRRMWIRAIGLAREEESNTHFRLRRVSLADYHIRRATNRKG
jgi:hypothetical protein